ncbi:MAG: hypothetical protein RL531_363 [Actinomycetota bacterium]
MSAETVLLPGPDGGYGTDDDRVGPADPLRFLRRRFDGHYPIDPFGGDPQLQDLLAPIGRLTLPVRVEGPGRLPEIGPALLVVNRGLGLAEPVALHQAVRREVGRRLRVVGIPDLPLVGDGLRKLGSVAQYPEDLGAVLRAGHLAALPLAHTWLRQGAGTPPVRMLVAALGFPVYPVAMVPVGPFGFPVAGWRVRIGAPIRLDVERGSGDPLAAAELAEAARLAVDDLLAGD